MDLLKPVTSRGAQAPTAALVSVIAIGLGKPPISEYFGAIYDMSSTHQIGPVFLRRLAESFFCDKLVIP